MTDVSVLALAASDDSSGYAEATSWRAGDLDPAAVAREAAEKAARTRGATPIEPQTFRAVLEPYAVSELLFYFAFTSLNALALLEGRSYLSGRLGEKLFDERFTVLDDGLDPLNYPKAFDLEGVPKQRVLMIEEGVAARRRLGPPHGEAGRRRPCLHRACPGGAGAGIRADPLQPLHGRRRRRSVDELAELVGDGIYVTRLHYLGVVDPREGIITGMTRDGTFRIEDGKVTTPVVNLRFTTSFPALAAGLLGLTKGVTLVNRSDFYDERYPFGTLVPAVATDAFTIVGTGSGPGL